MEFASFFHIELLLLLPHSLANSWALYGETWGGWEEGVSSENRKGLIHIGAVVSWLHSLWPWPVRIANCFSREVFSQSLQRFPGWALWWHFSLYRWMFSISRLSLATPLTTPKNSEFTSNFLLLGVLYPSVWSFRTGCKMTHSYVVSHVTHIWCTWNTHIFAGLAGFGSSGLLPIRWPLVLLTQGYLTFSGISLCVSKLSIYFKVLRVTP